MSANNTTNYSATQACDSASSIAVAGWCVFCIGITSNALHFYSIVKILPSGKRNDKLSLSNITVANFLSLFGNLLGVLSIVLSRGNIVSSAQSYCLLFHEIKFISLFANLTSMAGLCYDRYEYVTLFPAQQKRSFKKSIKLVVVGARALPLILVPIAQVGFFVTILQGKSICKVERNRTAPTSHFLALIVLVSLCITAGSTVIWAFPSHADLFKTEATSNRNGESSWYDKNSQRNKRKGTRKNYDHLLFNLLDSIWYCSWTDCSEYRKLLLVLLFWLSCCR